MRGLSQGNLKNARAGFAKRVAIETRTGASIASCVRLSECGRGVKGGSTLSRTVSKGVWGGRRGSECGEVKVGRIGLAIRERSGAGWSSQSRRETTEDETEVGEGERSAYRAVGDLKKGMLNEIEQTPLRSGSLARTEQLEVMQG